MAPIRSHPTWTCFGGQQTKLPLTRKGCCLVAANVGDLRGQLRSLQSGSWGLWARAGTQQLGLSLTEAGATLSTEPDMCFASKPPVVHAFRVKADKQRRASNRIDAHSDSGLFADLIVMFFSLVSRRYVSKVVLIVHYFREFPLRRGSTGLIFDQGRKLGELSDGKKIG